MHSGGGCGDRDGGIGVALSAAVVVAVMAVVRSLMMFMLTEVV